MRRGSAAWRGSVPFGSASRRILLVSALCGAGAGTPPPAPDLLIGIHKRGTVFLRLRDRDAGRLALAVRGPTGGVATQEEAQVLSGRLEPRQAEARLRLSIPGSDGSIVVEERVRERTGANQCEITYLIRFDGEARIAGLDLGFSIPSGVLGPQPLIIGSAGEDAEVRIPAAPGAQDVGRWRGRSVRVPLPQENVLELALDRETWVSLRDLRRFGQDGVDFRFELMAGAGRVPSGTEVLCRATLRAPRGLALAFEPERLQVRTDTRDWFPYPLATDEAPVDLGFLADKPAGTHGFLTVRGDRFVFQDGTEAHFWGVNLGGGACFPEAAEADAMARRLSRCGVNLVRLHAMDATWAVPNIFRFREGKRGTRTFDPESLKRLDGLVAALAREGIYVAFDLLVSRRFSPEDGVAQGDLLDAGAKPYACFDPGLIALQREYAEAIWTHRNGRTDLAYRDDPAIVLQAIADENDLLSFPVILEPYRGDLERRYAGWRRARGLRPGETSIDVREPTPELLEFLVDVQREYYEDMEGFLRGIGVRVPITGSNGMRNLALEAALDATDYRDAHAYRNVPHPGDGSVLNAPMVRATSTIFSSLSFRRAAGVPFIATEWDEPWPNDWRAELPLWVAAISAFQGWGGAALYAYRTRSGPAGDALDGPYDALRDPCRFGLFPHAALIARRDVRPARTRCAFRFPPEAATAVPSATPWALPGLDLLPELHRVEVAIGDAPAGARILAPGEVVIEAAAGSVVSDTGEIRRSWEEGWGAIDTPGTQAVYGFVGRKGRIELGDLAIEVETPFAVVALSSLGDEPIRRSGTMLLTAVARAENTGLA
ncbi:MAG: hypothetical protein JXP34_23800, partial [Planctomycetes bacterium]|nr:hypothetical protein [Planctomycetota bacterium]